MKETVVIPPIPYSASLIDDIEYKRVPATSSGYNPSQTRGLKMQILVPRSEDRTHPQTPCPIVVYSVGGGWATPLVKFRLSCGVELTKRGFLVVMPEYRGREYFRSLRDPITDVRSAVRYIRKHAATYFGDPDKIVLMGDSAGGHLSLLAAYAGAEYDDPEDDLRISAETNGVIDLFGPVALGRILDDLYAEGTADDLLKQHLKNAFTEITRTLDIEKQKTLVEGYTPLHWISRERKLPPTLIAQGDRDVIVQPWNSEMLYDRLTECGQDVRYYLLPGARHGDMRFYGTEMTDRCEDFIRYCVQ